VCRDWEQDVALRLSVDGGAVLADLGYRSKNDALALAAETGLLLIMPAAHCPARPHRQA
jgi:hypothetical protein